MILTDLWVLPFTYNIAVLPVELLAISKVESASACHRYFLTIHGLRAAELFSRTKVSLQYALWNLSILLGVVFES